MSQESRHIYRVKYTKGDSVKYISHLDFLRSVNRSFKRGKIPVKYSNGFNPHVLLNIALPCPVGVSSVCELLDIELYEKMECSEIKERLSKSEESLCLTAFLSPFSIYDTAICDLSDDTAGALQK